MFSLTPFIIPFVVVVALILITVSVKIVRQAAKILSSIPAAMQLRYLQTLTEIGAEQNSTIIFPMPIDIIKPFLDLVEKTCKPSGANGAARLATPDDSHANA
jgi:hypothetical protein